MEKATPDSAIDFVKYFLALYNYAYSTLDPQALGLIATDTCRYCQSVIDDVHGLASQNNRVTDYMVELKDAASPPRKVVQGTTVIAIINQEPGTVIESDGTRRKLAGVKNLRATFGLDWRNSHWHVRGVDIDRGSGTPWSK